MRRWRQPNTERGQTAIMSAFVAAFKRGKSSKEVLHKKQFQLQAKVAEVGAELENKAEAAVIVEVAVAAVAAVEGVAAVVVSGVR